MWVDLAYGSRPLRFHAPDDALVVRAPAGEPPPPLEPLLRAALNAPIGAPRLEALAATRRRITIIVSDGTRREPRAAFVAALRQRLPADAEVTVAVANGTHAPRGLDGLGLPAGQLALVDHDGDAPQNLVELGVTRRGTPVILHRCVVNTDLVIATGCIRPHYFAGFGAGVKAIFPGLGQSQAIRTNHRLKLDAGARPGIVDGNPCREDLEEALDLLPAPVFLLNGVCAPDGEIHAAVAGDARLAFRSGAEICRARSTMTAPRAPVVVVSAPEPITSSLYQASKLVAAVAGLVEPPGRIVVAAQCRDGIGPIDVVNRAIYEIGLAPRLPPGHEIFLVSDCAVSTVEPTFARWAPNVESVIPANTRVTVLPNAASLIIEPEPWPTLRS